MIEKFFDLDRVLISFIVTIVITVLFILIAVMLKLKADDITIYVLSSVLFVLIKLFFANWDVAKENKEEKDKNK